MSKRRVKDRRKSAREFKQLGIVHGGRKKQPAAPSPDQHPPPFARQVEQLERDGDLLPQSN